MPSNSGQAFTRRKIPDISIMATAAHKKNKAKPAKLTEFFPPSQSQGDSNLASTMQATSSNLPPREEHIEVDPPEVPILQSSPEQSMQQLFDTFRQHVQADFRSMFSDLKADLQSLISRTDHVEKKMSDFAKSHNSLIDSHATLEEEVLRLSAKVLDLEDRSRRNNIRIRGIPESVSPDLLRPFLIDLMAVTLPNLTQLDLTIDRIHRIPKPRNISAQAPRDTIARIHFYHVKDEFLRALRRNPELPDRFSQLSIYPDLSAATMLRRKEFSQFTRILRDNNIQYRWGFPVKLIIFKNGTPHICPDPAATRDILQQWNLLTTPSRSPPRKRATKPQAITPLWSDKNSRSRNLTGD